MTALIPVPESRAPAVVQAAGERASYRFLEFFAAQVRNANTRRSYMRAVSDFIAWLDQRGVTDVREINSFVVSAYVEELQRRHPAPTVKQRLAGIRAMLDWLATGGIIAFNPATAVRGPRYSVKTGKTPVLAADEARQLLDSIDVSTTVGLRDKALIGLMVYSFARIGAAVGMKVEDVYVQKRRLWVRLHEKGGKRHEMPCHHSLERYLADYMEHAEMASVPQAWLFQTIGRGTGRLSGNPMPQASAYQMVQRRAEATGIATKIGNHTF